MSGGRSLSPEENERVCAATRTLVEKYGSQAAVARALKAPDGSPISQQSVSLALRNLPVGVTFARAVAMELGIDFEELVTGRPSNLKGLQRNKDLPGWAEGAAQVAREQLLPTYAITEAGEFPVAFPVKTVDATYVYDQGALWLKHAPLAVRQAAERRVILAERAAREAQEDVH
jgi:hypothetical protein